MYSTNYHRASSLAEASALGAGSEAKYLSGGMTLIPAMKTRLAAPSDVIDISRIAELKGITVSGGVVRIGAATTHFEVSSDVALKQAFPAFCRLASLIGDPLVRHLGTIGGSIANNDPAADYPAAMLALGATIITDRREIAAENFFTGLFETALEDGEILTAVQFPIPEKAGYEKFRNPASRYAIVGVFVAKRADGVRVAVAGAGDNGVFRSPEIEAALAGSFDPSAVQGVTVPSADLMGDLHASPEYRANLIVVMAKRAVAGAM
jgi:carbon-monoxide dehydrogenase medium subunit